MSAVVRQQAPTASAAHKRSSKDMTAHVTETSATSAGPGGARTTPAWMKAIVQDLT
jgi:hypothetical protein